MMKKIKLFLAFICYILSFLSVEAKRVEIEKAEKVARSHARITPSLTSRRDFQLSKTVSRRITRDRQSAQSLGTQQQQQQQSQQQDEPMFYVFTMNGDGGFIVVSGDDVAKPILGYSDSGTYDETNPNLAYWMETLSQEIANAVENNVPQDEEIKAEWEAYESGNSISQAFSDYVEPLIKTKWDQRSPYYNLCPTISGIRTLTGCVATVMAQIMKYYNHPTTRTVKIPGYTTKTNKITVTDISAPVTYSWSNMTDKYSSSSSSTSQNAVAKLMYDCGASVEMDYGVSGSGAYDSDVVIALTTYFGYDAGLNLYRRDYYSSTEWINLLKTELSAKRPVYYSGFTANNEGHAFVCDGYDDSGKFHFNWGWSGNSDGYFVVTALNTPSGSFNAYQTIITGIQPDKGGESPNIQLGLSSLSTNKSKLSSLTESFNITAIDLMNIGSRTITNVYLGVLLYRQTTYLDYKTVEQTLGLEPYYYYSSRTLLSGYSLPSDLTAGTYRLYPAYSVSSGIPSVIRGENGDRYITVIVASDGSVTLSVNVETDTNAQCPTIDAHPQSATYKLNTTATALSVSASVVDGGSLSYQWYSNTTNSYVGGVEISGATSTSYTPPINTVGRTYYYATVTNSNSNVNGLQTVLTTSNIATITVVTSSAPSAPTLDYKTALSVTLKAMSGDIEYSRNLVNWQYDLTFDNLSPDTEYTFYTRFSETATSYASPPSAGLKVRTYAGRDAELLNFTVDNKPVSVTGSELNYQIQCNAETWIRFEIEQSDAASVTVTVNNAKVEPEYDGSPYSFLSKYYIPLSGDATYVNIRIVSGDKNNTKNYTLSIANPLDGDVVLFYRWSDVIAVNRNSSKNGNRNIEDVRWYYDNTEIQNTDWYIQIEDGYDANNYRAEIKIDGKWHQVCNSMPRTRSEKVIVYPNPVARGEKVTIELPDSFTGGVLNIYSITGALVKSGLTLPVASNSIDVSEFAQGIYLLYITDKTGNSKVVKMIIE